MYQNLFHAVGVLQRATLLQHARRPAIKQAEHYIRHSRVRCASTARAADHEAYIRDVAHANATNVSLLLKALQAQGHTVVPPNDNASLHPFAIPLAEGDVRGWGGTEHGVLCILRWPSPSAHPNMETPVVLMQRGGKQLRLIARSADEYITRLLVDEDRQQTEGNATQVADALGADGQALYSAGNFAASGMPTYEAYMIKNVGHFPDVSSSLIESHLGSDDEISAMVAAEWTMRNFFFHGWATAFELATYLYVDLERDEEARDTARLMLKQPWWTIRGDIPRIRELSKLSGTVREIAALFDKEKRGTGAYRTQEEVATPQELAEEEADVLMNEVTCGEISSWDNIRPRLIELYRKAGKADFVSFLEASSQTGQSAAPA